MTGIDGPWRPPIYSTARLDALVCPMLVPASALRDHLPPGIEPDVVPDAPAGCLPVVLEVWRVNEGSIEFAGRPFHAWWELAGQAAGGWWGRMARRASEANSRIIGTYNEILVTVPCRQVASGGVSTHVGFVLRACTDSAASLVGERFFGWGYQKTGALGIATGPGGIEVRVAPDAPPVQIAVRSSGSSALTAADIPRAVDFFTRPLVGLRPPHLMLSWLDRTFTHTSVRLTAVEVDARGTGALHGALADAPRTVAAAGAHPWGAFMVTGLPVTLTYPQAL